MPFGVRILQVARWLYTEAPPLVISLIVAERFFKFGTFILEAVTFLVLWQALDALYTRSIGRWM